MAGPGDCPDHKTGRVLMMARMNREALQLTAQESRAIYWSRSRGKLWRKGEESGSSCTNCARTVMPT